MQEEFKVGDIVRLKSGGPKMSVHQITGQTIRVHWFYQDGANLTWGALQDESIPIWCLEKVAK